MYKKYKIYLDRDFGNKIKYADIATEEKLMLISKHLIDDMNCELEDAYIENDGIEQVTVYIIKEPKGVK